jgi:hypothetical protein
MPNTADWKPSSLIQILVYGKSKTGKTFGAYTFPRPVVMDFDKGVATVRNPDFVKRWGIRNFPYEQFTEKDVNTVGIVKTHNAFDDSCRFFDEWMKKKDQFDTWIIDSGTSLSEKAQAKAVIVMGGLKLSKTHTEALREGILIPKIQDYGSERSLVEQFVTMILDSGKHVVFICHEKETVNEAGQLTGYTPLLTGKSTEAIPLKFDEVYRLRAFKQGMDIKRELTTHADGMSLVGSRYGVPDKSEWNYETIKKALDNLKSPAILAKPA